MVTFNSDLQPSDLPAAWRAEAERLKRWPGNDGSVLALQRAADELEESMRRGQNEKLTLAQASVESGYSVDHLGRLLRDNPELNCGRKNAPRICRRNLPVKPGHRFSVADQSGEGDDMEGLFRDIVNSKFGG